MIPVRANFVYSLIPPKTKVYAAKVFERSTGLSADDAFYLWCQFYGINPDKAKKICKSVIDFYIG